MSQPSIPDITPLISLTKEDSVNMILASIAMQEMGISHIINAEAEKLQYVLGQLHHKPLTPAELSEINKVNCSARDTIKELMRLEMLLQAKLDTVKALANTHEDCAPGPDPAPDPPPCPDPHHSNTHHHPPHHSHANPPPDPNANSPNASDPPRLWWPPPSNAGHTYSGAHHKENHGGREHHDHADKGHRTIRCIMRKPNIKKRCRGRKPCLSRGRFVQRRTCRRKKRCAINVRQTNKPVMKNVVIIKNIARNHTAVINKNRAKAAAGTGRGRSTRRRSRRAAGSSRRANRCAKSAVRETMFPGLLPQLRR